MNFTDIARLSWKKNIQGEHIVYSRTKTRHTKSFRIPIIEPLKEILGVCKEYSPKGYVFPILDASIKDPLKQYSRIKTVTRETNKVLKEIGKTLEIETPLTTYVARHTFASVLKLMGTTSPIIKEMLGHTKEETTEIYLKNFGNDTLDKVSQLLKL
jgi:integrase